MACIGENEVDWVLGSVFGREGEGESLLLLDLGEGLRGGAVTFTGTVQLYPP